MNGLPIKISVIIPIYNVSEYLNMSLGSCAEQTLNDVEFICVNDGSTDDSLEIVKAFAEKDHRFRIIDKENGGISSARNAGLDAALGEYIMFLDADDYLEPNACERVWLEKLEAPTDVVIFSANIFPRNPMPIPWYYAVLTCPTRRYWEFESKVLFEEPSAKPFIWHQAFKKSIIDEHNIRFDENIKQGEDQIFIFKFYPYAENFCFLQDRLYNYRWYRENSAMWKFTQNGNLDGRIEAHLLVVEAIAKHWHSEGFIEKYGLEFTKWAMDFLAVDILDKKVQSKEKHFASMKDIANTYGLRKYFSKLSGKSRKLAKRIPKV
ncbi:MAG: glycosyltransferase family 2 protein [Clostridia bacterium]|nr:glycosyltransferase family 2 protein [Clostridia bacterium]